MFKRKPKHTEPDYESEYLYKSEDDMEDFHNIKRVILLMTLIAVCVVSGFLLALHFIPAV